MICKIRGKILKKNILSLIVDIGGVCYEVFVPKIIMAEIDKHFHEGEEVELFTYHYLQVEPSKSFPVLIGFINEIEREFFESFITVSGIGPKAALKALNMPISNIAQAIDEANMAVLKSLPGIGEQRAREVVAKLQGKVGKFGLLQDKNSNEVIEQESNFEDEAVEVLKQLQYKVNEAKEMVARALHRSPHIKTAEELLNEVYKQKIKK